MDKHDARILNMSVGTWLHERRRRRSEWAGNSTLERLLVRITASHNGAFDHVFGVKVARHESIDTEAMLRRLLAAETDKFATSQCQTVGEDVSSLQQHPSLLSVPRNVTQWL